MPRRAILSASDKRGLAAFARGLVELGFEILATGGTEKLLKDDGIAVTPIEQVTGFPECFSGRVKTMHPKIMGGILYRRSDKEHEREAAEHGIAPIDLVAVNLYPFEETVKNLKGKEPQAASRTVSPEAIEQIDIGGPTLLRSAAKNHAAVTVICDPADYDRVLLELQTGDTSPELRAELAAKVFVRTAAYDAAIAETFSMGKATGLILTNGKKLRYGENPHQSGWFFECFGADAGWQLLQGKELSYLNILDADGAWTAVREFEEPTAVFVKHVNPAGIASHKKIEEAFQRAYDADRLSAFGVIIALNRECSKEVAQKVIDQKMFVEVMIAPAYATEALEVLKQKPNIRVIEHKNLQTDECTTYRTALGGMLLQSPDNHIVTEKDLKVVTKLAPTKEQIRDLLFAWKVVKHAKSNAIVFAKGTVTVGIGAGQTSRVDATWIAAKRAGEKAKGAVMASDAFFPFPDSVEEAAKHGIAAIIQPGGSIRDAEVFSKADALGLAMVVTGVRAFRH